MYRKIPWLVGCMLLFAGCVKAPQTEKQTLVGLDKAQVFVAAQHTLAAEGYQIEEMNAESGSMKTGWRARAQGQVQFEVQVADREGAGMNAVEISVSAVARKKTLAGWSDPMPTATADSKPVLDKIVEKAISAPVSAQSIPSAPKFPVCANTSECVAGTHCASGMCVSECSSDHNGPHRS